MTSDDMKHKTPVVDVHTHLYPRTYIELLKERERIPLVTKREAVEEFIVFPEEYGSDGVGGRPFTEEYWDIDLKIAFMDSMGIDHSVLSLGNPWMEPFNNEMGDEATSSINEIFAKLEGGTKGRIVGLGVLPSSSVESALGELENIASTGTLRGVVTGPRIAGYPFDAPALGVIWEKLEETRLPLFVHPQNGVALDHMRGYRHVLPVGLGFPMETTIAISRLVFGGVLERYPETRIMAAHGGGCLPYLSGRLDAAWNSDEEVHSLIPRPPSEYLKMLYLDALVYDRGPLMAATSLVGKERLMLGTDHPFSVADHEANMQAVEAEFTSEQERDWLFGRSAAKLFGLHYENT